MGLLVLVAIAIFAVSQLIALSTGSSSTLGNDYGGAPNRRIIQGEVSKMRKMPYMVRLVSDGAFFCGGSIITKRHVLTAGHCFRTIVDTGVLPKLEVTFGIADPSRNIPRENIREVKSARGLNHTRKTDICILTMKTSFPTSVEPIILSLSGGETNEEGLIGGWGKTEDTGAKRIFRTRKVTVIDNALCKQLSYNAVKYQIDWTVTCVTPYGCWGDSGGPLVINNLQVGVYSGKGDFGNYPYCIVNSGLPDWYTNVYVYKEFIDKETNGAAQWRHKY